MQDLAASPTEPILTIHTQISIATTTKKNVPIYNLVITVTSKSASSKPQTINIARSFTEWFDAAGHFVASPFQNMLASSVPAIGRSDSKRLQKSSDPKQETTYSTEMLDAVLAANAGAESSGTPKKGGKRRKA